MNWLKPITQRTTTLIEIVLYAVVFPFVAAQCMKVLGLITYVDQKYPSESFWILAVLTRLGYGAVVIGFSYFVEQWLSNLGFFWHSEPEETEKKETKETKSYDISWVIIFGLAAIVLAFMVIELFLRFYSGTMSFYQS